MLKSSEIRKNIIKINISPKKKNCGVHNIGKSEIARKQDFNPYDLQDKKKQRNK